MKKIEEYKSYCKTIGEINTSHSIADDSISIIEDMDNFKVIAPIIGHFSVGKSFTINQMLGQKRMLPTDTRAETAIPAELTFGEDVIYAYKNGKSEEFELGSFDIHSAAQNGYEYIEMRLRNSVLEKAPNVKIVDMPGFESVYDSHGKAIYDYLPKSIVYIIFLSAEKLVLEQTIIEHIKKLDIYGRPTFFVINRCDRAERPLEEIKNYYRSEIAKHLKVDNVKIYCTGRKCDNFPDGSAGLNEIVNELESSSDILFDRIYAEIIKKSAQKTVNELSAYISGMDYDIEKIKHALEKLDEQEKKTTDSLKDVGQDIYKEAEMIADEIGSNIRKSIMSIEDTLFNYAVNKQELAIASRLESIVDTNISNGVKKLDKKLVKYFANVRNAINKSISYDSIEFNNNEAEQIINNVKKVLETIIPVVGETIGSVLGGISGSMVVPAVTTMAFSAASSAGTGAMIGQFAGPIGAAVGAVIGLAVSKLISNASKNKQIEKAREPFHSSLSDYCDKVATNIKQAMLEKVSEIEDNILHEANAAFELSRNGLNKAKMDKTEEADKILKRKMEAENDIGRLEEIINEI